MVFKFTDDLGIEEVSSKRLIKKKQTFHNKIIFINGFGGSGKTMLSPIISSMQNVESLIFPYEIQWISAFLYSLRLSNNLLNSHI